MKKNIKCALMIILMQAISICSYAQIENIINVASPDAAKINLYGNTPVGYYTGTPNISIPIYDINVNSYQLPISIDYHLQSVRATSQEGQLGIGWSLNAGGQISRIVRGIMDESKGPDTQMGYLHNKNKLSESNFYETMQAYANINNDAYELTTDEYSFSFCGYTGSFYLNPQGEWVVVSDYDIKVDNHKLITRATLVNRFNQEPQYNVYDDRNIKHVKLEGINNLASYNDCFLDRFTLITPDGCRYEFGGENATEYSIPYYKRDDSTFTPTTWKLTKITDTNKKEITFKYAREVMCDLRYCPQTYKIEDNDWTAYTDTYSLLSLWGLLPIHYGKIISPNISSTGNSGYTGAILYPVALSRIECDDVLIKFHNCVDISYQNHFLNGNALVATDRHRTGCYGIDDNNDNFNNNNYPTTFLPYGSFGYHHGNTNKNIIAEKFLSYFIDSISIVHIERDRNNRIHTENLVKKYSLGYGASMRRELTELSDGECVYNFDYYRKKNGEKLPADVVLVGSDRWGFYNGTNMSPSSSVSSIDQNIREEDMKACTLKSITYPTGGKTVFEYEKNDYSIVAEGENNAIGGINDYTPVGSSDGHDLYYPETRGDDYEHNFTEDDIIDSDEETSDRTFTREAGGLRLKSIADYDSDNNLLGKRKFYYKKSMDASVSSGIVKYIPQNQIKYTIPISVNNSTNNISVVMNSTGGFYLNRTGNNSPDIAYSWVIESFVDSNDRPLKYKRYHYTNYDEFTDIPPFLSSFATRSPYFPHTSLSMKRGKILSEETYDSNWGQMEKIAYSYSEVPNQNYILTGTQNNILLSFCIGNDMSTVYNAYLPVGWLTKTYTYSYMPQTVTRYQYHSSCITDITTYGYNEHKMHSSITERRLGDNNSIKVTTYKYTTLEDTDNSHEQYRLMGSKHIYKPWEIATTINGVKNSILLDYGFNEQDIPYNASKRIRYNSNKEKNEYIVERVDRYGNPIQVVENGLTKSILWDDRGNNILMIAENMNYDDMRAELIKIGTWTTSFLYNQGRLGEIATAHKSSIFTYDAQGRLTMIEDFYPDSEFVTKKSFQYGYKNNKQRNTVKE